MTIRYYSSRLVSAFCLGLSLMACASDSRNQLPPVPAATPAVATAVTAVDKLEGYHDISNCNGVMGWAWNQEKPDDPIQIELYDDATLLATVTAGDFRQDLLAAHIGNGKHGFTFVIPASLKDGKPHKIKMKFAGADKLLNETPREIKCAPATP